MKLIKRSCPFPDPAWPFLELDIKTVKNLAGILKMMKSKDQDTLLMTFFHLLWLRVYPGNVRAVDDHDEDTMVQLDCAHPDQNPELCDEGHHVRFSGFSGGAALHDQADRSRALVHERDAALGNTLAR